MAKTIRRPKTARRSRRGKNKTAALDESALREIALKFPDVEEGTTERGVAFTVRGRLLTCAAVHASAEPGSIVVRVSVEQRARLLASYPDALYLPDHYAKHPAVLARIGRLDRDSLRDILGAAWLFVTEKAVRRKRSSSRSKR
jgi:hypothetical protein